MIETTLIFMGIALRIRYTIHSNGYIEWYLANSKNEPITDMLRILDLLLRINHSAWLEASIREQEHYDSLARATGHSPNDNDF